MGGLSTPAFQPQSKEIASNMPTKRLAICTPPCGDAHQTFWLLHLIKEAFALSTTGGSLSPFLSLSLSQVVREGLKFDGLCDRCHRKKVPVMTGNSHWGAVVADEENCMCALNQNDGPRP